MTDQCHFYASFQCRLPEKVRDSIDEWWREGLPNGWRGGVVHDGPHDLVQIACPGQIGKCLLHVVCSRLPGRFTGHGCYTLYDCMHTRTRTRSLRYAHNPCRLVRERRFWQFTKCHPGVVLVARSCNEPLYSYEVIDCQLQGASVRNLVVIRVCVLYVEGSMVHSCTAD